MRDYDHTFPSMIIRFMWNFREKVSVQTDYEQTDIQYEQTDIVMRRSGHASTHSPSLYSRNGSLKSMIIDSVFFING